MLTKETQKYVDIVKEFGPNTAALQAILDTEARTGGLLDFKFLINKDGTVSRDPRVATEEIAKEMLTMLAAPALPPEPLD